MIRTLTLVSASALALAGLASAETQTYDVSGFSGIDVSAGIDVTFSTGSSYSVSAENKNGDFSDLKIETSDDALVISRVKKNWTSGWNKRQKYAVTVTAPSLSFINASSGSDITGSGLSGDQVSLSVSSGADIDVSDIDAVSVSLESSSGSDLNASGTCDSVSADSSSGSDIEASGLICRIGDADASSGSDIEIHATESVTADASSGADIDVYGGPTITDIDKSSGGSVSIKS